MVLLFISVPLVGLDDLMICAQEKFLDL